MVNKAVTKMKFQSTRPIRGATIFVSALVCTSGISIHAPHTGRDVRYTIDPIQTWWDFNPRAPYGARLTFKEVFEAWKEISIHAPHTGRDCRSGCKW